MLILFIYVTSISFGHLEIIKYQDIIPVYNKNQPNPEQLLSPFRDSQKNTEFQIYDIRQNIATKKSIDNLKDIFSKYRKKNCLTDKTVYDEEPHNKDIQNEIKNENVFKNQEKEVQLKTPIARYNFDSPNTYCNFQLNSYVGEDMKRSGETVKDNSYVETKFDDSKSTRRFAHNIFNQNILSDELKTIVDHNLRPNKSQTKSEKFDQPKDPNIIINSDGKYRQMNNYNEISYDDDNDEEYRSSSRELEKQNNDIANQLRDPTKGLGISEMTKSHMMIMEHPRVCYACSSINDFSCWTPNRLTSVKYCHEDHTSCLTKIYKDKDVRYITRDCGSACVPSTRHEFKLKYDFCTICHADLCNNGLSTHIEVIIIIIFVLIHIIILF